MALRWRRPAFRGNAGALRVGGVTEQKRVELIVCRLESYSGRHLEFGTLLSKLSDQNIYFVIYNL